jgi:hypothetical protein
MASSDARLGAVAVGVGLGVLYARTAFPSITGGDR